jgi:hypothetical protein
MLHASLSSFLLYKSMGSVIAGFSFLLLQLHIMVTMPWLQSRQANPESSKMHANQELPQKWDNNK